MKTWHRKLLLAVHIAVSVGWIGGLAAYLALDLRVVTVDDPVIVRAAYLGMAAVASSVIVPMAVAAFVTGLVISLTTRWGLFRHYWVLVSLVLTGVALVVLLFEMQTINHFAAIAADRATSDEELGSLGSTLVHSIGGMVVLLAVLVLNIFKPKGMTRYGWRKQQERMQRIAAG